MKARPLTLTTVARPRWPLGICDRSIHEQHLAVGSFGIDPHAALFTIFHRADGYGELVARLECVSGPAAARQIVRAHSFDSPGVHATLIIGYVEPDPGVRITVVEFF